MHTVIIDGRDLAYFKSITTSAVNGELGEVTTVQLYVNDNGRIQLATNGFTSAEIGRPNADLSVSGHEARMNSLTDSDAPNGFRPLTREEGSGNPYANVPQQDPEGLTIEQRVQRLELFSLLVSRRHDIEDLLEQASTAVRM